jgi:adenosylcobinamide-GDP ribazoletransferase
VIAALAFLTPLGRAREPDRTTFDWFPAVGALLGAAVGVVWWGADQLWTPLVAATLAVAADVALTGALHVDGLADAADGVLPHLDRDRRLAVMTEPDVGAFGVTAVVVTLGLRVALLASLRPGDVGLLAALWCASRTVMAVTARSVPYARGDGGLAAAFLGRSPVPVALVGTALAAALALTTDLGAAHALAAVAAVPVAGAAVVGLARRRLGGFTGDVLGAAGLVGETVGLLVAAARW